jgi:protein-S-isoprenylcysteine O-methyltransferase Ste14
MFSWLGLVILLGAIGTSSYYRLQARRGVETIARRREGVPLLGIRVGVAALLLFPVVGCVLIPQKMVWASFPLPFWCRWLGVIIGVSTIPAIAWVLHSLGQNVSETVLTKRNHRLVRSGPYRWVRHPLYSAGIALFLALSLIDSSWLILLIAVIVAAFLQVLVIPSEEQALLTKFGNDYRAYTRSTGRFLPRVLRVPRSVHALTLIT